MTKLGVGWISHGLRPLTNTDTSEGQSGGREDMYSTYKLGELRSKMPCFRTLAMNDFTFNQTINNKREQQKCLFCTLV